MTLYVYKNNNQKQDKMEKRFLFVIAKNKQCSQEQTYNVEKLFKDKIKDFRKSIKSRKNKFGSWMGRQELIISSQM